MTKLLRLLAAAALAATALGACSSAATPIPSQAPGSAVPSEAPASAAPPSSADPSAPGSEAPSADPSAASVFDQAWATGTLTDVATGEPFRIADLAASQVVVIEPMAIWCPKCKAQQIEAHAALEGIDGVAYVVLTVDPSEDAAALARYRDANGFTGYYAVAGPDISRALAADFGDLVVNPPSTPMIVTSPDGRVTLTEFGQKSGETILALVEEHRA
jgi:thiol-disulfide isomerase/thioredoxin